MLRRHLVLAAASPLVIGAAPAVILTHGHSATPQQHRAVACTNVTTTGTVSGNHSVTECYPDLGWAHACVAPSGGAAPLAWVVVTSCLPDPALNGLNVPQR